MGELSECQAGCLESLEVDRGADRCAMCGRAFRRPSRPGVLRAVFWNRRHFTGAERTISFLDAVEGGWDVALLVECQRPVAEAVRDRYGTESVASVLDHHRDTTMEKPHGPMVIVRNGLRLRSHRLTFPGRDHADDPRPDKSLTAEVDTPWGAITVLATHVMHGGDGYGRKMATYRMLTESLAAASQPWPVVVGLDGNNWYDWLDPEDAEPPDPHDVSFEDRRFHGPSAPHQLNDTFRVAVAGDARRRSAAEERLADTDVLAGTHRRTHALDRMDRIYASPDLTIVDAGIDQTSFQHSDHALVWADLRLDTGRRTIDPDVSPKGPRASKEPAPDLDLDGIVEALVEGYGWNRRGYVARVALGTLHSGGAASQDFIDDHYRHTTRPDRHWRPTRTTCNRGWERLGGARYADEFISYDPETRAHSMPPAVAETALRTLEITDLMSAVISPQLEDLLAERLDPHRDIEPDVESDVESER